MSQVTTHILDTSAGKPAAGVTIIMEKPDESGNWSLLAQGITNEDGRIGNLFADNVILLPGYYKLRFDTGTYFRNRNIKCFYPSVEIIFEITDSSHYHVPLLLNPYGYSTYRGS
jgi:5-hydroxyisourate hydrolase